MKPFQNKKIVFTALIFLAILIMGVIYLLKKVHYHHDISKEPSMQVEVAGVKLDNIPIEVHAIGSLTAAQDVQITTEFSGLIAHLFVKDGQFVKKGETLIQLDDSISKAKLLSAKAALLYSQTDYDRKKSLGKLGAISQQAIDQALADLEEKKAAAEESEVMVNKMKLIAPFDGVLGKIKVSPGDFVTAGQALVSLTDIIHLHVEYAVSEKYLSQLKLGQTIKVTTSVYPNQYFLAKIAFISPTINADNRTIALYAELINEHHLLTAGLFVNVKHELGIEKNAVLIPSDSLLPTIDGQQVYKIVNDKAKAIPVEIVQRMQNEVQVLGDLQKGEEVVIVGQQKLKEGMLVERIHQQSSG